MFYMAGGLPPCFFDKEAFEINKTSLFISSIPQKKFEKEELRNKFINWMTTQTQGNILLITAYSEMMRNLPKIETVEDLLEYASNCGFKGIHNFINYLLIPSN